GETFDVVSYMASGRHRGRFCHLKPDGSSHVIDVPNTYATELSLERRTVILKLHGGVELESFVVTEDDYIDYLADGDVGGAIPVALAAKLTVLYGPSGVGNSSILRAAVARRLREIAPEAEVLVLDEWAVEPTLPQPDGEAFLILDQFEEYFLYHDAGPLHEALPALLAQPRVHVLLALREDALARLDVFQAQVPGVLANRLRLDQLDRSAARAAIVGPLDHWNAMASAGAAMAVEASLVEEALDEVESSPGRIEAP